MRWKRTVISVVLLTSLPSSSRSSPQRFSLRINLADDESLPSQFFQEPLAANANISPVQSESFPAASPSFPAGEASQAGSPAASFQNFQPANNRRNFPPATPAPPLSRSAPAPSNSRNNFDVRVESSTESLESALKRNQQFRKQWEDAVANHQRIVDEHTNTILAHNETLVQLQDKPSEKEGSQKQQQSEPNNIAERPLLHLQQIINNKRPKQQQQQQQQQQEANKAFSKTFTSVQNEVGRRDPLSKAIKANKSNPPRNRDDASIDLEGHSKLLKELQVSLDEVEDLAQSVLFS